MSSRSYSVRGPEDLLAVIPFALGFHPEDSVVLVTFGAGAFHARVDLPATDDDRAEIVDMLAHAARRNHVDRAAVVLFSEDEELSAAVCADLVRELRAGGIEVVDAVRADGRRWWRICDPHGRGTSYDLTTHPFTAERVLAGQAPMRDRSEVAESLVGTDLEAIEAVAAAAARCPDPQVGVVEARWMRWRLGSWLAGSEPMEAAEVARLLRGVNDQTLRDVAWSCMSRCDARAQVDLWRELLRRAPYDLVPGPAAVLAFAAWLCGDGALAWCALDRCHEVDPDHSLADLVATALTNAIPPDSWVPVPPEEVPALNGGSRRAG